MSSGLYICSYIKGFALFIFMYSVVIGMSFGLLYMPGLKNAWQYFPSKKGFISGLVLSCYSVGAILWTLITKAVANPRNEKPLEIYKFEDKTEYFYYPEQDVVKNVPQMLRLLAYIYFGMNFVSVILIQRRKEGDTVRNFCYFKFYRMIIFTFKNTLRLL